jgi:DNA-binding NarL/FixJ family response regulator
VEIWLASALALAAAVAALGAVLRAAVVRARNTRSAPVVAEEPRQKSSPPEHRTRLLIVDDHPVVCAAVRALIEASAPDIEVVGTASDGDEGVQMSESLVPDVVLMDIRMQRMDGIEATRQIKRRLPTVKVVILTTYGTAENVYAALSAGATGFITKQARTDDLVGAVRAAAEGECALDSALASTLIGEFETRNIAWPNSPLTPRLGAKERDILHLLAQNMSYAEVTSRLKVDEGALERGIGNIVLKLQLHKQLEDQIKDPSRHIVYVDALDLDESP